MCPERVMNCGEEVETPIEGGGAGGLRMQVGRRALQMPEWSSGGKAGVCGSALQKK